jgi:hypothetical protein
MHVKLPFSNGGLPTSMETTSSVAQPTGFSPTSQQTIHQATQRPAKFARELADSELNTGSHPIIIAGARRGDTRRPFAKGSCNRSALRVRSTT